MGAGAHRNIGVVEKVLYWGTDKAREQHDGALPARTTGGAMMSSRPDKARRLLFQLNPCCSGLLFFPGIFTPIVFGHQKRHSTGAKLLPFEDDATKVTLRYSFILAFPFSCVYRRSLPSCLSKHVLPSTRFLFQSFPFPSTQSEFFRLVYKLDMLTSFMMKESFHGDQLLFPKI